MEHFSEVVADSIRKSEIIKGYYTNLKVSGKNPWELTIDLEWKDSGIIKISSFILSDFWAFRDFWKQSLDYKSKSLFPLFPDDERLERCISNHYKNHESRRDIIYNAWSVKEGLFNEDFDNEIIGHFYLNRCNTRPEVGIGVANKFQRKGLGQLFMLILINTTIFLGKDVLYLGVDLNNKAGITLYKKLGFENIKEMEIYIPVVDWKSVITEMKLDLKRYL